MNEGSTRRGSRFLWIAGTAVLVSLVLALKLSDDRPATAACQGSFSIDFAGLAHGEVIDNQYAAQGVHVSVDANNGFPDAIIAFDTDLPPTHDVDLAVDIGNIAILAKNLTDSNSDGLVDDPDENDFGGKVTFTFDQDVSIGSFKFVDHDHQPSDFAAAYDASDNLITKVLIPIAGNGSVQTVDVNANGVRRFELVYRDSGGFTGIEVSCPAAATPTPTSTSPQGATATPTTPAEATSTPTATPTAPAGATSTPTGGPTAAAVTATPAPAAGAVESSPAATSQTAVAGAVTGPSAQGFPVTGDGTDNSALAGPGVSLALTGALAVLIGGVFLIQRRRAAQAVVAPSTGVHRPRSTRASERGGARSSVGGLVWVVVVGLYAAIAMAGPLSGPRRRG
jgi:hypothetical protein